MSDYDVASVPKVNGITVDLFVHFLRLLTRRGLNKLVDKDRGEIYKVAAQNPYYSR
jgi:hypothetical protein